MRIAACTRRAVIASALATDPAGDHASCAAIADASFGSALGLAASSDPEANVTPASSYTYFDQPPVGLPAF
jgi:streptogramin lyase